MLFYLEPKNTDSIVDYLAENGEFIGILNSPDKNAKKLEKEDISLEKISENQMNNKYLVANILYNTWEICLIMVNKEAFAEIKLKYKQNQSLWYWIGEEHIKNCLSQLKFKEFKKSFSI